MLFVHTEPASHGQWTKIVYESTLISKLNKRVNYSYHT